jgi:hypothetical protein
MPSLAYRKVEATLAVDVIGLIDDYRKRQEGLIIPRAEAIRRLIMAGLAAATVGPAAKGRR